VHEHDHGHSHTHDYAAGSGRTEIQVNASVMEANDRFAHQNRVLFQRAGVYAVNIMSSPGAGKTTVVEALARRFGDSMAVIVGDVQTTRDAERVIRAGSRAHQIQTAGACHLDAHSVAHALEHLDLAGCKLLVIENVGNLVCPAGYDLGEHDKIAILSLPEGDDKVLKYPALFHRINMLLINKTDLAPHVEFDVDKAVNECRSLNRAFQWFAVSAKTGQGMDAFFAALAVRAGL